MDERGRSRSCPILPAAAATAVSRTATAWLVWVLSTASHRASAFTAYDCSAATATYTSLDLTASAECPDAQAAYEGPFRPQVQLLQRNLQMPLAALQCRLTVTRQVTYCQPWSHHQFGAKVVSWLQPVDLTPTYCRRAFREGKLRFDGILHPFNPGAQRTISYWSHGHRSDSGYCSGAVFHRHGKKYVSSYEETTITIQIGSLSGSHQPSAGTVSFPGVARGFYEAGSLRANQQGTIVWTVQPLPCEEAVSELYTGTCELHAPTVNRVDPNSRQFYSDRGYHNSVVLVKDGKRHIGLKLRGRIRVCGKSCYATHLDDLALCVVAEQPLTEFVLLYRRIRQHGDNWARTDMSYLHLQIFIETYQNFRDLLHHLCRLKRQLLNDRLRLLAGGDVHALLGQYGPGHVAYVVGTVAYIVRGREASVTTRSHPKCTLHVPVWTEDGQPAYFDPLTLVLRDFSPTLPCSEHFPVAWKVDGHWLCLYPNEQPSSCRHPPRALNTTVTSPNYVLTEPVIPLVLREAFAANSSDRRRQQPAHSNPVDEQLQAHRLLLRVYDSLLPLALRDAETSVSLPAGPGGPGSTLTEAQLRWLEDSFASTTFVGAGYDESVCLILGLIGLALGSYLLRVALRCASLHGLRRRPRPRERLVCLSASSHALYRDHVIAIA